jgi:beta-glucosidase
MASSTLNFTRTDFPDDFTFGVATSAYQIEGAKYGGCGPSHWDTFAATPGNVKNGEDGSVACDHYHRYESDLDLIANANLDHYRFSVSWARPMLTLHHWDMPAVLADHGGWQNREIADQFASLAEAVTHRIGDRQWKVATFNEPWCIAWLSHFHGAHAPGLRDVRATARTIHHVLLAHSKAMMAMRAAGVKDLGIVLNFEVGEPATDNDADMAATARYNAHYNECFLHPLFKGAYAPLVLEGIEQHLPEGWHDDLTMLADTPDWLGINYYTRKIIAHDGSDVWPAFKEVEGPLPKTEMGWEVSPDSFGWLLRWVRDTYTGDLPLYITENGMAGPDELKDGACNDPWRIDYLDSHVSAVKSAMDDGVPVKGYTAWSLMDNFEWALGYDKRFGIVHVDYDTLERTPKASWHALKDALKRP